MKITWYGTEYECIRKYSKDHAKFMWGAEHPKLSVAVVILFIILCFFAEMGVSALILSTALISLALYVLLSVDFILSIKRTEEYLKEALVRGGETSDKRYYERILSGGSKAAKIGTAVIVAIVFLIGLFICFVNLGTALAGNVEGASHSNFSLVILLVYFINASYWPVSSLNGCIFLDLDEGMIFGSALFSYDFMEGLVPTKFNDFELFHDGKKVASGNMPAGDFKLLREILDVKTKYREELI